MKLFHESQRYSLIYFIVHLRKTRIVISIFNGCVVSFSYGFVSFKDPTDFTRAIKELNGKYVGSRPIKLSKSSWKDRNVDQVKAKQKEKKQMGYKF